MNHLGNVLATISDRKTGVDNGSGGIDHYIAEVLSQNEYYPGGMVMPDRSFNSQDYRFGFQNQEIDKELWGGAVSFAYRVEDPRLVRFFSVDPLAANYPHNSPYAFGENRLIDGVELEGLEWAPTKDKRNQTTGYTWAGYNNDGTPKSGTVTGDIITKGNFQYWYTSDAKNKSGAIDIFSLKKEEVPYTEGSDRSPLYNYHINIKQSPLAEGIKFSEGNYAWNETNRSKEFDIDITQWDKLTDNFFFTGAKKELGLNPRPTSIEAVYPEALFVPILPKGTSLLGKISARIGEEIGQLKIPVYRVFGGSSRVFGESWTFINPKIYGQTFRNFAGLPRWNSGTFLVKGTVKLSDINSFRMALPLHGNIGRFAPELLIKGGGTK